MTCVRNSSIKNCLCALAAAAAFLLPAGQAMAQSSPIAYDDAADCWKNDFVFMLGILGNDTASAGIDATTVEIVSGPANGVVYVDPDYGDINYFPDQDYVGTDTFEYRFRDNYGNLSNVAVVTITVRINAPPVISNFSVVQIDTDVFWISGTVADEDISTVTVYFGGILQGETATVQSNGTFGISRVILPSERGLISVQATDEFGQSSNTVWGCAE